MPTSFVRRHRCRRPVAVALGAATVAAATLAASPPAAAHRAGGHGRWLGTWAAGPLPGSGAGFTDTTVREIVHTSIGGNRIRIRLTNAYGAAPVTFANTSVGLRASGAGLAPRSERTVTFHGDKSVTVPAGGEVLSDPVALRVGPGTDLAVSLYVPDSGPAPTRHTVTNTTSYYTTGDHAADPAATAFTATTTRWYLLDGVQVAARPAARGTVVTFGDSITDGNHSSLDGDASYPQDLARRLAARHGPAMAVLNEGDSGNRILTDAGHSGDSALHRFTRDALGRPGVRDVIFLEGINDIGHDLGPGGTPGVTAAELIQGMRSIIAAAHARHVRIIGATLTPIGGSTYFTPAAEAKREAVNHWIRTAHAFDGYVDFDTATRDPADPTRFAPRYDSGDGLHPDDAGYQAMADAIDLHLLR